MRVFQKAGQQPKIISVERGNLGLVYTALSRGHHEPLHILHRDLSQIPFKFRGDDEHNFTGYREMDFLPKIVPTSNGWYSKCAEKHLWGPVSPPHRLHTFFTLVEYSRAHERVVRDNVRTQVLSGELSQKLERYACMAGVSLAEMRDWSREWQDGEIRKLEGYILAQALKTYTAQAK